MKIKHRLIGLILLLLFCAATPAYAINAVDAMLCKRVVLRANDRTVLVNRITGEVKYLLRMNGQWDPLTGSLKHEYQAMYNAQVHNRKRSGD